MHFIASIQYSFERIDRRTKVMRSQMKKRQTVDKYKNYAAPKGTISNMLDPEDFERVNQEENLLELENGETSGSRASWHITQEPEWVNGNHTTQSKVKFDLDTVDIEI